MLFFVLQVIEDCHCAFALTAYAENVGLVVAVEIKLLAEITGGREAVFKIGIDDAVAYLDEVGAVVFLAIFEGVESIEHCASDKAHFGPRR